MANIFEAVREAVPISVAAERYGLNANRAGMVCCPFHDDHKPSLKLNEDYFYCFGCGAGGDVVELTRRLFDLRLTKRPASWRLISAWTFRLPRRRTAA